METPAPHPREAQRLAALRALHVLDTGPEPRFDALTRTACRLFGVPTALISLVDADRQWFKSRQGLSAPETPRDISFCGHAILGDRALVVEDALRDPRFRDNPLVAGELGLRFYAGMPLFSPGGLPYGTLCLLDYAPRPFTPDEEEALRDLALLAEDELNRALPEDNLARVEALIASLGEGVVFQDLQGAILSSNPAAEDILGLSADQMAGRKSVDPGWQAIHEDGTPWPGEDHPSMRALRSGRPELGHVMGVRTPDGRLTWILVNAQPVRDTEGALSGVACAFLDITERKRSADRLQSSEERFRLAFEYSGTGMALIDLDGRWNLANRALCAMLGYEEAELRAFTFQDLTHPDDRHIGEVNGPRLISGELPVLHAEKRYLRKDGTYLWARLTTTVQKDADGRPHQYISQIEDVTSQKEAEATLRKAQERYRAMTENVPGVMYQFQVWPDGRFEFPFISRGVESLYGISPEQWQADPGWALNAILEADRPSYEAAYAQAARTLRTFAWEGRTRTARPGETIWIRCQSQPNPQEDGSILWDGLVTDTTTLHQQAEAQARLGAFQRSVLQSAEVAIISTDLAGTVTSFNAHAEALLGWPAEEVVGKTTPALWHDPEELAARAGELSRTYGREITGFEVFAHQPRMGGTEQRQWTYLTRDGYRIPILLTVSGIRDETDTLVGFLGIGADLRALKAREAALRASEQQFRDLVSTVPGIVFQSRPLPDGRRELTFISDYTRVLLGMEPAEALANPQWLEEMVLPEDRDSMVQAFESANSDLETREWVGRIRRRPDGLTRWIRIQATPWVGPDGAALWNGLILDLTERIGSELALRESEERLALVLKGSNDAPWDWDLERGSHYYSPRWWEMLGYADNELEVEPELLNTLIHPDDRATVAAALEASLQSGRESYEVEYRLRHKDGHYLPVLARGFILRDEAGRPHRISGTNMDLTERKAVEEALRHSEERWSLALQANNDGIWDWNTQTGEVWFSPRYLSMLGYGPEELPPRLESWSTLCHPDDLPGALAQVQTYLEGRSSTYQLIFRMRHKDGTWRWVLSRGVGRPGPDGRMVRIVGSHQDVTMQREAEEALVASQARSQALLEAMPDLIFLVRRDGLHLEVHAHSESSLRLPKEQILGKYMKDVMPPDLLAERLARIERVLDTGNPETYEARVETMAGIQDHETRVVPCGRDTVLVIARDITERKALERLKNDFISTVSHELRTPLTSIKGALGLMSGGVVGDLPPKALDLSNMALENANRLARLIDDLLDLAKTESAELSLEPGLHDLRKLVEQAMQGIAAFAQSHQVALMRAWKVEVAPARVDGDRLIQVVLNLLSNAVKYSHPGGAVQVRLDQRGRQWRLEVENHGPEIPEAFRARIFQKFAMADGSDTRARGGTGLGLAISKALVERMGGTIDYHSGGGRTVFYVDLPLAEEIP
ncbi:MAG TPA: PAS domain S-box protein [Holophagaceae bacterium]|nr:PAS domain S-box protein [Holophagaceae bacterium]